MAVLDIAAAILVAGGTAFHVACDMQRLPFSDGTGRAISTTSFVGSETFARSCLSPSPQFKPLPRLTRARPRYSRVSKLRRRKAHPNVVIVLIDDMGFGQP